MIKRSMIKKMGFYEAWYAKTKKAVFSWILLVGILVLTAAYALKVCT